MLERIILKRFQKHKRKVIDLDPYCTTLVGPSDSGKTTIIRGLRFISLNQVPKGRYIRRGEDSCSLTLVFDDGKRITRFKSKRINTYKVNNGKPFKAVGTKVPEKVANLLNIGTVNFQSQLDLPFWFTQSPGQISKNLNEIVNLGVIDTTLSNVATILRKARSELEVSDNRLKEASKKKKDLAWVIEFDRDLRELENLDKQARKIRDKTATLETQIEVVQRYSHELGNAKCLGLIAEEALSNARKLRKIDKEIEELDGLIETMRMAEQIAPDEMFAEFEKLERLRAKGDKAAEDERVLRQAIESVQHMEKELCLAEKEVRKAEKKLAKELKGKCPVCGAKLKGPLGSSLETFTAGTLHRLHERKKAKLGIE